MAKGQVTFEFNDEQIAEIQRRVCDGVEHILGSLQKENQELKDENKRLRETPSRIAEYTELKKEIQELREKLSKSHEEAKQAADIIFYFLKRFSSAIDDIATFEINSAFLHDLRAKYK